MSTVRSLFCKDKIRILGYVNRLREYPTAAVAIFFNRGKYFAAWPSTDITLLSDVTSEADLCCLPHYHKLNREVLLAPGTELVFAFSKDDLLVGTTDQVRAGIRSRLRTMNSDQSEAEILKEYLFAH